MKTRVLVLLMIISLGIAFEPVQGQVPEGSISLEVSFDPEPDFNQMVYNENYVFDVTINNLNLDLDAGDVVSTSPRTKFSGDLVVHVSFIVSKEGGLKVGAETQYFVRPLLGWEESNDVALPAVGSSESIGYSYRPTTEYGRGFDQISVDDWVTFNVEIQVYLWEYIEISGEPDRYLLSDSIGEAHLKFHVISDAKIEHVNDVFAAMDDELDAARDAISDVEDDLERELDIDLSDYEAAYAAMNSHIEDGDYVSAQAVYEGYEPTWWDDVVTTMQGEVDALEGQKEELADENVELKASNEELQSQIEDVAAKDAEIADLEAEIETLQSNSRLYLFGIVALGVVLVAALVRMFVKLPGKKASPQVSL
jgi:hypothetical protein